MEAIFGVFFCLIVGGVLIYIIKRNEKPAGTFVIDFSDPTKDVCSLEMNISLGEIYTKKKIVLDVKTYGDDSLN